MKHSPALRVYFHLLLWLGLSLCFAGAVTAAEVTVSEVREERGAETVRLVGRVVSTRTIQLVNRVPGEITYMAELGQQVAAGEALVKLANPEQVLALREQQAVISQAERELAYLSTHSKRLASLYSSQGISETVMDESLHNHEQADFRLQQAQIRLQQLQQRVDWQTIEAPFAGVVTERLLAEGQYLAASEAILTFTSTAASDREVIVKAPYQVARHIRPGDMALVVEDESETRPSRITRVVPHVDDRDDSTQIRIATDTNQWLIGQSVDVELQTGALENRLVIPSSATFLQDGQPTIFKLGKDSRVHAVAVSITSAFDDFIAVKGDLQARDSVVVSGLSSLKDGDEVTVRGIN